MIYDVNRLVVFSKTGPLVNYTPITVVEMQEFATNWKPIVGQRTDTSSVGFGNLGSGLLELGGSFEFSASDGVSRRLFSPAASFTGDLRVKHNAGIPKRSRFKKPAQTPVPTAPSLQTRPGSQFPLGKKNLGDYGRGKGRTVGIFKKEDSTQVSNSSQLRKLGVSPAIKSDANFKRAAKDGLVKVPHHTIEFRCSWKNKDQFASLFRTQANKVVTSKGGVADINVTLGKMKPDQVKLFSLKEFARLQDDGFVGAAAQGGENAAMIAALAGGAAVAGPVAIGGTVLIVGAVVAATAIKNHHANRKNYRAFLRITTSDSVQDRQVFPFESDRSYMRASFIGQASYEQIADFIEANIHNQRLA